MKFPFQKSARKPEAASIEDDAPLSASEMLRFSRMRLSSVVFIGYRNMFSNRMRSILTIGGVAIGIGIITLLIALGFGVQGMVIREVTKNNPSNIIDVSNKSLESFVLLDKNTLERIRGIDGVEQVERRASIGGKLFNGDSQTDMILNAISRHYLDLARSDIPFALREKLFTQGEAVIITPKLAALLGYENPEESIGKMIEYSSVITSDMLADVEEIPEETPKSDTENMLTIVGVAKDQAKDDAVYAYISMEEVRERYGNIAGQFAKVRVRDESVIEPVRLQIEQASFVTESVVDTVADINSFFLIVRSILIVFGVIIMSISAMGMLNTLSISLLQRTKEVGILKALGTKRADIFKMFILEAFLISFFGGAIGLLCGYGVAIGVNYGMNLLAAKYGVAAASFVEIPSAFIISIIVFIFFLGLVTGIFPAMRASKIHALEALRYE
jgi:ABC-type antimicrobial peptide transport system permease subunit